MGLHHLPWSQSQTVTSPTSGIFNSAGELTAVPSGLSRIFLEESRIIYTTPLLFYPCVKRAQKQ